MAYSNNQIVGNAIAGAAITPFSIVSAKTGTSSTFDNTAILANGTNGKYLGIGPNYAVASGEAFQFTMLGEAQVQLGVGGCNDGDFLTADTNGTAIAASTITINNTTGSNQPIIGIARKVGVAGDIIPVQVVPGLA